jgi:hypothetical protein
MLGAALLTASLLLFTLSAWAVFASRRQASPQRKTESRSNPKRLDLVPYLKAPTPAPKQLVSMLNGDAAAASRLIQSVQRLNPQKDIHWCIDKVLTDLERDRRQ